MPKPVPPPLASLLMVVGWWPGPFVHQAVVLGLPFRVVSAWAAALQHA